LVVSSSGIYSISYLIANAVIALTTTAMMYNINR
jgi:hypothetical protein